MDEYARHNLDLWNEITAIHIRSEFYDLPGFKAGKTSLKPIELAEVGEVRGKSLLHLQCHFGMDTISWARLGARVTGVDFSEAAVSAARAMSAELGIGANFLCCDIYDLPNKLRTRSSMSYTRPMASFAGSRICPSGLP